jgi:ABC-type dipeptide/oligopeptide/nickel transport system ATPase component
MAVRFHRGNAVSGRRKPDPAGTSARTRCAPSEVLRASRHPFSPGHLTATVRGGLRGQMPGTITGVPPDLTPLTPGSALAPHCRHARDASRQDPIFIGMSETGAMARCVLPAE